VTGGFNYRGGPRYRVATQVGVHLVWDSVTGARIAVFNAGADAQAEADRLKGMSGFVTVADGTAQQ
jgi:hypothetical protein